jgi:glycosyltransferase involved in cell wall biosynthesis
LNASISPGPHFAVIIPVYNGRAYLKEAIESVLSQKYPACEIIVVEDGSPIPSDDIVLLFPEVRYVVQTNTGVSGARNHGVRVSQADWVCFLDQDDVLLPHHLQQFAEAIEGDQNADFLYTPRFVLTLHKGTWIQEKITTCPKAEELKSILLKRCPFPPSGICIRRSAFEKSGGFSDRYNLAEDWEFWLRCIEEDRTFRACSLPTVCYRVHSASNSHRPIPILRANTLVIRERIAPLLTWPRSLWHSTQLISQQEADAAILLRQLGSSGAFSLLLRSLRRWPIGGLRRYLIALHMLLAALARKTGMPDRLQMS